LTRKNIHYFERKKLKIAKNLKKADYAIAISTNNRSNTKKIFKNLKSCLKNNLKLICINPDFINLKFNYGMVYYLNNYSNLGGKCEYFGKPNPKFYKFICKELNIRSKKKYCLLVIRFATIF